MLPRHWAMIFSRMGGMAALVFAGRDDHGGPRTASRAANALPVKPLSASRLPGDGPGFEQVFGDVRPAA